MNKLLSTIIGSMLMLWCTVCNAQDYALDNTLNGQTITTCAGNFYDSDPNGNYGASQNYSVTFCSGTVGKVMHFDFQELVIAAGDTLFAYDGIGTNAHCIDTFTNVNRGPGEVGVIATDTNNTGCITFRFKSNATTQASGWEAAISCGYQCKQPITGSISTNPAQSGGYTDICLTPDDKVVFNLATVYAANGLIYNQKDNTSKFHWFFGDGKDTLGVDIASVSHTYTQVGGYDVKVSVTDSNGCINSLPITIKVRTGIKPVYNIQVLPTLCVGDTARITPGGATGSSSGGFALPQQASFVHLPVSSDSLFLPDAPSNSTAGVYSTSILIDQFAAGQTLTNINMLKGIFMNMEHSYLGDIDISITAPNGKKVILKTGPGAEDCFLGEPVDGNLHTANDNHALDNIRGNGYDYWFNASPQFGTMVSEANSHLYSYVDNAGQDVIDHAYLPSGSYTSSQSLNALVGTPLNGTWTLQITDYQKQDNGYLFNWHLDFDASLYPNVETYTVGITSQNWVTPTEGLISVNGTVATIAPTVVKNYDFVYRVVDDFGCHYDTTISIELKPLPTKPDLGPDVALCTGQTNILLIVSNFDPINNYNWSNGDNGQYSNVGTPGTYFVTSKSLYGCASKDTIVVGQTTNVTASLGLDTFYCASNPNVLKPVVSSNITTYLWNNGSTADTLKTIGPGTYTVKASTANGCNTTATINLTDNPVNAYAMPSDTVICDKSSFFITLNPPASTSITWNDGVLGNTRLITAPNNYTTIANNIGCLKKNNYNVTTKPLPVINLGNDSTICNLRTYLMRVSYPGATYLWNDNSTDSFMLVKNPGTYWVEALLNQCTYRDSVDIQYKKCDCETVVPNAFSPNGDGINDLFKADMKCVPLSYHLSVFNRWGQEVFATKDYTTGWDGRRNGTPLPVGTYYYIITYYNVGLQVNERFNGSITLLR